MRSMESRYRAILESAVDFAIVALDGDGLVTDWAGPLVELARAPVTIARTAYEAGRTGARRTLAVV